MEFLIAIIFLLVAIGFGIKYRYKIAEFLELRNVTPKIDAEEREIRLKREIEDCERALRRMKTEAERATDNK